MSDFKRCVKTKIKGNEITITCKIGLWSVTGTSVNKVTGEARHYFDQYKDDGEYSSIIGGKNVTEKLKEKGLW